MQCIVTYATGLYLGRDSDCATAWTVRGSNPGRGQIFRTHPDRPWGPPSLLYNGYRVFPGGKVDGAWHWPPTPSSAEVKERVELYLYSTSGPSWSVIGWPLPLPFLLVCICGYLTSAVRYKYIILDTCYPNTPYLREQGCEDPWLFFETKRGLRAWRSAERCPKSWLSVRRWSQNMHLLHHFCIGLLCQIAWKSACLKMALHKAETCGSRG
jgi:hypothetical protein